MASRKNDKVTEFEVMEFHQGSITFKILGTTPFICNRMSAKAMQQLLLPRKKTAADKATTLKHNPLEEFQASPYTSNDPKNPTLIQMVTSAFRQSMSSAALEIPGMKKAQVARLTWVTADRVNIYGVPQMMMSVTRSADINKTPDIRSRAIIPEWACDVELRFATPQLTAKELTNLMAAAGMLIGVGDWRNGKGSGSYGQFELVSPDDARYKHVIKYGGREAQVAAMKQPSYYDDETQSLYEWFCEEIDRRGKATEEPKKTSKKGSKKDEEPAEVKAGGRVKNGRNKGRPDLRA